MHHPQVPLLVEALEHGALVLFLGADLPQTVIGLPSRADLMRGLAERHSLDTALSLAQVAQRVGRAGNRFDFIDYLRRALDTAGKPVPAFYSTLAAFAKAHTLPAIVTTAYDDFLERALREAGVSFDRVVRGSDVAFARPDRLALIKLYGDVQMPDTLVVTEDDHYGLWRDRDKENLLDEVRSLLKKQTVLFLGYNLSDPDFHLLWREVLDKMGRFARTAYAVWPGLPETEVRMWADRGIMILDEDPWQLVNESKLEKEAYSLVLEETMAQKSYSFRGVEWDSNVELVDWQCSRCKARFTAKEDGIRHISSEHREGTLYPRLNTSGRLRLAEFLPTVLGKTRIEVLDILTQDESSVLESMGFRAEIVSFSPIPEKPMTIDLPQTPSISPKLYQNLQTTLLRCGPFRSDNALSPLFVDSRISQWRDLLPSRENPTERVQAVIDELLTHTNTAGKNALVLLLLVLRDRTSRGDACYGQLDTLSQELENVLLVPNESLITSGSTEQQSVTAKWEDINAMNPDIFVQQAEVVGLFQALKKLGSKISIANERRNILSAAGVDEGTLGGLDCNAIPLVFANALVAQFKNYSVSEQSLAYHPMVALLSFLLDTGSFDYGLNDQDIALCTQLVERGKENLKALRVRSAVGRIECPRGKGIGTGVLVGKDLLLTCRHVFAKHNDQQAWVRFRKYRVDSYELLQDVYELDMAFVVASGQPDYALVRIKGAPQQQLARPVNKVLSGEMQVRIAHHPLGQSVSISDTGKIVQVGGDYIDHDLPTADGSSGAPIFDRDWDLVAIHRGLPGIGRTVTLGTTEGVPIRAIWDKLSSHLS